MPVELPRIVVVEDDASMSKAIGTILRTQGFEPIMFASAEAALKVDAAMTADCLVLDVMLPGMSGFDLYRQLASCGAPAPTVFISARNEPAVRTEAERTGPDNHYLPKPFSGRTLLATVAQALSGRPGLQNEDRR